MPLHIGFDLDGVLADMESELARQAEILFGAKITRRRERAASDTPADATAAAKTAADPEADSIPALVRLNLSVRQRRRLWHHVASIENFWETLQEIEPGTVKRLADAAADHRWEVIFLTKRPETRGPTSQVQTQRWLQARGFPLPSVYVVQGSRGRIAAALALDVVVDDRPENCMDVVVDSKARAILISRDQVRACDWRGWRVELGAIFSDAEVKQAESVLAPEPPSLKLVSFAREKSRVRVDLDKLDESDANADAGEKPA